MNSILKKKIKLLLLVLATTKMVSSPPTDRQILDLQNAEACTACIVSFVAKCCTWKEQDKVNTDGTFLDLPVTNHCLKMFGQDAFLKNRIPMSTEKLLDIPFKEIRLVIENFFSPEDRVITSERAKFLSVIQRV